jgi:conjugative transfer region protein (TIGR03750 family)
MHPMPSSRHLSHDFPAWKGLSLRELFWLVITSTSINTLVFLGLGFMCGYPLIMGCMGFLISFILSITVYPKILARLKLGKPHGHLFKIWVLGLSHLGLMKSPWIKVQGTWRTTRRIGVSDA